MVNQKSFRSAPACRRLSSCSSQNTVGLLNNPGQLEVM